MTNNLALRNLLLCKVAVEVADDPSNVERELEVGVAAVDQRCVAVVCRHPWVVPSDADLRPCAVEVILFGVSLGVLHLCRQLRSVRHVLFEAV